MKSCEARVTRRERMGSLEARVASREGMVPLPGGERLGEGDEEEFGISSQWSCGSRVASRERMVPLPRGERPPRNQPPAPSA